MWQLPWHGVEISPPLATSGTLQRRSRTDIESRLHPFSSHNATVGRTTRQQMYLIHIHIQLPRLRVIVTVIIVRPEPVLRNGFEKNIRAVSGRWSFRIAL